MDRRHGAIASGYDHTYPDTPWYVITNKGVWRYETKEARDEARDAFMRENLGLRRRE